MKKNLFAAAIFSVLASFGSDFKILADVDIVVAGGSSAGVEAALQAAKEGAKVFVVAPRPYFGEDIAGTYKFNYTAKWQ